MKRIILFRHHKKPKVCHDRLLQLRKYNPDIKIFGLYGGKESKFPKYQKYLDSLMDYNYCIKNKTSRWKWKNSDLAIRLWYKDVGQKLEFDVLHLIEWDLLLFAPLSSIYQKIPNNCVGLTGLTPLKNVQNKWSWVSKKPWKNQWVELLEYVKDEFGYDKEPYASLGPGLCLPKSFLDKFLKTHIPDLCNDELRLPLFAQILGFKLVKTGFFESWSDFQLSKLFNCDKKGVSLKLIKKELDKKSGRKSFHPFFKRLKPNFY